MAVAVDVAVAVAAAAAVAAATAIAARELPTLSPPFLLPISKAFQEVGEVGEQGKGSLARERWRPRYDTTQIAVYEPLCKERAAATTKSEWILVSFLASIETYRKARHLLAFALERKPD